MIRWRLDTEDQGTALGALVVMVTLVAILSLGVFRLVALRTGAARRAVYRLQAQYAAESGIEDIRWRLSQPGGWGPNTGRSLTGILVDSLAVGTTTTVHLRPYGGYLEVTATGRCYQARVTVRALLGMQPPAWFHRAVTLGRTPYALVLTGRSRIQGDVLAGPGGVQTGRVPGDPPPPKNPPVDGTILHEGEGVEFDPWVFETTMSALDRQLAGEGITLTAADLGVFGAPLSPGAFPARVRAAVIRMPGPLAVLTATPADPPLTGPLTLVADGALRLQGDLKLVGPVMIAAHDSIQVADQVDIHGGLLYSPGPIHLIDTARLEGQALSRSRITVTDQAQVCYPGVLYATGTLKGARLDGDITVTSTRLQTGSFLVQPPPWLGGQPVSDRTRIQIGRMSHVAGFVYSATTTWLEGELLGSVATGLFILEHGSTTYLNWIKDGMIDRRPLTDAYRLPLGFGAQPQVELVTWEWLEP